MVADHEGRARAQRAAARDMQAVHANLQRALFGLAPPRPSLGRYEVIRLIGEGGFGSVYEARDPQLERRVALKIMLPRVGAGPETLLREGRSIARVAHPNVVAVHEVGTSDDGELYLAMELLTGGTLRAWADDQPRSVGEIVAKYAQAARGLAAIHGAGLVHGDFKPDNGLLGEDGRVRVADFGLARLLVDRPGPEAWIGDNVDITRVAGTPLYMAPEQHRGKDVDAWSDQHALCVSLFETVYGSPPFHGSTYDELVEAVSLGRVRYPERPQRRVPRWLKQIMLRGLQVDPRARFPSMEALADALERDRSRPWKWSAAAIVVGASVAAGFALGEPARETPALCDSVDEKVRRVWDLDRQRSLGEAVAAPGDPSLVETWSRARERVEDYVVAWEEGVRSVCASPPSNRDDLVEMGARLRCLDHRLSEVDRFLELAQAEPEQVALRAAETAWRLSTVSSCLRDAVAFVGESGKPDPQAEDLRHQLAKLRALRLAADPERVTQPAVELVEQAMALGHAPIEAESRLQYGVALQDAGAWDEAYEQHHRAALVAHGAGMHRVAAEAWTNMIAISGFLAKRDQAMRIRADADRALARIGDAPLLEAYLYQAMGAVHLFTADPEAARAAYERALELKRPILDEGDPDMARAWNDVGTALEATGDVVGAIAAYESGITIFRQSVGEHAGMVGTYLNNLGAMELRSGQMDAAQRHLQEARRVMSKAWGTTHPYFAMATLNLARYALATGDLAGAAGLAAQSEALLTENVAADHPFFADTWVVQAQVHATQEDWNRALELAERAYAIHRVSGQTTAVAATRLILAQALERTGSDRSRAQALAIEARDAFANLLPGWQSEFEDAHRLVDAFDRE